MKRPRIVLIEWVDACSDFEDEAPLDDNVALAEFGGTVRAIDVGWFVERRPAETVIALTFHADANRVRHSNTIPNGMIVSITDAQTGEVLYGKGAKKPKKSGNVDGP